MTILVIAYFVASYWAYGRVFEYNKVIIYTDGLYYRMRKFILGAAAGFILIPVAIIRTVLKV